MITLVMGLPGSGKSFFASRFAKATDADYISSDRLRKNMFTNRTYSGEERERVYKELLLQMRKYSRKKSNLVLDATFYSNVIREKFINEISKRDEMAIIEVTASEDLIRERLRQKRDDSEADYHIYKKIKAAWEIYPGKHLVLRSTNDNIDDMVRDAMEYLQKIDYESGTGS